MAATVPTNKRASVGFGETVDSRIAPDVKWIEDTFNVKVTAGYSLDPVHEATGDHPKGLAVDIIPADGNWDNVDRLAAFAAKHPEIFRWVGYDGRFGTVNAAGHGRGDHLHLSWHGGGTAGDTAPLKTLGNTGGGFADWAKDAGGKILGTAKDGLDVVTGPATGKAADAAASVAKDAVGAIWNAVGDDGARALLYAVLVFGGTGLALAGLARATGVGQLAKDVQAKGQEAALLVATKGAV